MKTIIKSILLAASILYIVSCSKADNMAGPNAAFEGNIIDSVTGKNILTGTQDFGIACYDISWRTNPDVYTVPIKQDGSFEDTRFFSGHFQVLPNQGPFWPVDTTVMDISGTVTKNFTVVPYIEILNFTHRLSGDTLIMNFQIDAPRKAGLPEIADAWPFVNTTSFVSSGAFIAVYTNSNAGDTAKNTLDINSNWDDSLVHKTFELRVPNMLSGRTFYARVGVRVNDSYRKFNYSDIVEIDVP